MWIVVSIWKSTHTYPWWSLIVSYKETTFRLFWITLRNLGNRHLTKIHSISCYRKMLRSWILSKQRVWCLTRKRISSQSIWYMQRIGWEFYWVYLIKFLNPLTLANWEQNFWKAKNYLLIESSFSRLNIMHCQRNKGMWLCRRWNIDKLSLTRQSEWEYRDS